MNKILNDFGDCLYIDISTATNTKQILIDTDLYNEFKAKGLRISIGGRNHPVVYMDGKPVYLQRYIMNPPADKMVIHRDGLDVDFRKSNLKLSRKGRINIGKRLTTRDYWIASCKKSKTKVYFELEVEELDDYEIAYRKYHDGEGNSIH